MADNKYSYTAKVLAFTLDEIILNGMRTGAALTNGMPWSFRFCGHSVTHESDDEYLIDGAHMTHKDILIINVPQTDVITILPMTAFSRIYEDRDD